MKSKKPADVDVAVLCIFFARPEVFRQCFERVREARPSKLLLLQDGPRPDRTDDIENIQKCREIASDIDWECEVHTNYHSENMGCDPSTHLAHKWAFSIVDKCIILEDDIVPSISFFHFCKVLLDKYEKDKRIDRICGMNILGEYPGDGDYLFCRYGNSWGWASWRRSAENWESDYAFLDHPEAIRLMESVSADKSLQRDWERQCRDRRSTGKAYWEFIVGASSLLNSGLCIYPRKNMIKNVGVGVNSTHAPNGVSEIDKATRQLFFSKTYEMSFPLREPRYMIADEDFLPLINHHLKPSLFEFWKARLKRLSIENIVKKLFPK